MSGLVSLLPRPAPAAFVSVPIQVLECNVFTLLFIVWLAEGILEACHLHYHTMPMFLMWLTRTMVRLSHVCFAVFMIARDIFVTPIYDMCFETEPQI